MAGRPYIQLALTAAALFFAPAKAGHADDFNSRNAMTRINVIVGDEVMPATLDDTPAAQDFASMLPLDLTLRDYHGIEKVADLDRKLDDTDAPRAYAPEPGDITQYRPWGNLAIFYKPFQSSAGLLRLGEFDGSLEPLMREGNFSVRIELAD
ncbi:cyclophilin-like fold protein [Roseovarius sp. THAF9]|uniref:cyclophilin-like fold protein n=1 Tax=Roseovarius sp. THAF9 TaxID=2587847 RepID=UPI0020C82C85|nr:cyclophilin-like fold protein [Roseovarius sp. THAF9]